MNFPSTAFGSSQKVARSPLHAHAFTLTELLVVLAIIGFLASLLLPGLVAARRRAATAACLNNARQVALACHLYAGDSGDQWVLNVDGMDGGRTNWVAGNATDAPGHTNIALLADQRRSLLSAYLTAPKSYKCPADKSSYPRSISMNCRLNPHRGYGLPPRWIGGEGSRFRVFRKLGDLVRPSSVFVTLDESEGSINDAYFAVDLSHTGTPEGHGLVSPFHVIDVPSVDHEYGAVFSWADGSATRRRWASPATFRGMRPKSHVRRASPDVDWLQSHCSHE